MTLVVMIHCVHIVLGSYTTDDTSNEVPLCYEAYWCVFVLSSCQFWTRKRWYDISLWKNSHPIHLSHSPLLFTLSAHCLYTPILSHLFVCVTVIRQRHNSARVSMPLLPIIRCWTNPMRTATTTTTITPVAGRCCKN